MSRNVREFNKIIGVNEDILWLYVQAFQNMIVRNMSSYMDINGGNLYGYYQKFLFSSFAVFHAGKLSHNSDFVASFSLQPSRVSVLHVNR